MGEMPRIAVVLLQLGTPDAPTPAALRRYLAEFLSDRRVVDLPRAIWWPILHGVILRTRPKQSAALYRKVWTPGGSPLARITAAQAAGLERCLNTCTGSRVRVAWAMRYGNPSIAHVTSELARNGIDRILAFPMYPQYAGATTGSSLEKLFAVTGAARVVPSIRVVPPYFDDPGYISALAAVARQALAARTGRSIGSSSVFTACRSATRTRAIRIRRTAARRRNGSPGRSTCPPNRRSSCSSRGSAASNGCSRTRTRRLRRPAAPASASR